MSSVNNSLSNGLYKGLDLASYSVTNVEPFEKISKIIFRTIDFFSVLTKKVSAPVLMLGSRLKDTCDITESLGLCGRVKELVCPDEKGQYFFKKSSWQKCADRILLAVACVFKTINSAVKLSLVSLGKLAKLTIGRLPVFRLVPDCLVAVSSFFGTWESKNNAEAASAKLKIANRKVEKWAKRSALIEQVRRGNYAEFIALKNSYQKKVAKLEEQIKALDAASATKEIAIKKADLKKYQDRLAKIEANDNVGLADDLAKADISFKQKKWSVEQSNAKIMQNKAWFGIANGVSKIFVITMATTMTALSLASSPHVLTLLAAGVCVDSIGLTKALYDYSAKPQNPIKEPASA